MTHFKQVVDLIHDPSIADSTFILVGVIEWVDKKENKHVYQVSYAIKTFNNLIKRSVSQISDDTGSMKAVDWNFSTWTVYAEQKLKLMGTIRYTSFFH